MRQKHIDFIENAGGNIVTIDVRNERDEALAFIVEKDGELYRCTTSSLDRKVLPWISKRKAPKRYVHGNDNYLYKMLNEAGDILYIGKTSQLDYRMYVHFYKKAETWKEDVTKVMISKFDNEADMHIYEMYLITKHKPTFNRDAQCSVFPSVELPEVVFSEMADWK